jgi:hypothetical protein
MTTRHTHEGINVSTHILHVHAVPVLRAVQGYRLPKLCSLGLLKGLPSRPTSGVELTLPPILQPHQWDGRCSAPPSMPTPVTGQFQHNSLQIRQQPSRQDQPYLHPASGDVGADPASHGSDSVVTRARDAPSHKAAAAPTTLKKKKGRKPKAVVDRLIFKNYHYINGVRSTWKHS